MTTYDAYLRGFILAKAGEPIPREELRMPGVEGKRFEGEALAAYAMGVYDGKTTSSPRTRVDVEPEAKRMAGGVSE